MSKEKQAQRQRGIIYLVLAVLALGVNILFGGGGAIGAAAFLAAIILFLGAGFYLIKSARAD